MGKVNKLKIWIYYKKFDVGLSDIIYQSRENSVILCEKKNVILKIYGKCLEGKIILHYNF